MSDETPKKKLTQRQKAVAERAVKIRANGLIQQLEQTATEIEKTVELGDVPGRKAVTADLGNRYNGGPYIGLRIHLEKAEHAGGIDDAIKERWKDLRTRCEDLSVRVEQFEEAGARRIDDLKATIAKERENLFKDIEKDAAIINEDVTDLHVDIERENEVKQQQLEAAKAARLGLCNQLRAQRDEQILQIAMDGEMEAAEFLSSLPTPEAAMKQLADSGFTLANALQSVTGIGETNPKTLSDPSPPAGSDED